MQSGLSLRDNCTSPEAHIVCERAELFDMSELGSHRTSEIVGELGPRR